MKDTLDPDQKIARIIYRNQYNMMEHTREVMQLEDFVGRLAGIYDLLMYFFMFFFGSYINVVSKTKWIKNRYFVEF